MENIKKKNILVRIVLLFLNQINYIKSYLINNNDDNSISLICFIKNKYIIKPLKSNIILKKYYSISTSFSDTWIKNMQNIKNKKNIELSSKPNFIEISQKNEKKVLLIENSEIGQKFHNISIEKKILHPSILFYAKNEKHGQMYFIIGNLTSASKTKIPNKGYCKNIWIGYKLNGQKSYFVKDDIGIIEIDSIKDILDIQKIAQQSKTYSIKTKILFNIIEEKILIIEEHILMQIRKQGGNLDKIYIGSDLITEEAMIKQMHADFNKFDFIKNLIKD